VALALLLSPFCHFEEPLQDLGTCVKYCNVENRTEMQIKVLSQTLKFASFSGLLPWNIEICFIFGPTSLLTKQSKPRLSVLGKNGILAIRHKTARKKQISPNAFQPFNPETPLSYSDTESQKRICQINSKKTLNQITRTVICLLNHNGRVKVNFLRTMNVTVTELAERS